MFCCRAVPMFLLRHLVPWHFMTYAILLWLYYPSLVSVFCQRTPRKMRIVIIIVIFNLLVPSLPHQFSQSQKTYRYIHYF